MRLGPTAISTCQAWFSFSYFSCVIFVKITRTLIEKIHHIIGKVNLKEVDDMGVAISVRINPYYIGTSSFICRANLFKQKNDLSEQIWKY